MPGIEKMISITKVPVMMNPSNGAIAVTAGISEFRSTCTITIRRRRSPFALAVRT